MDNHKIIAEQAIEISKLKTKIKDFEDACQSIYGQLYSVGSPLNDNVLQYSKKQLFPFFRIADEINEVL